MVVQNSSLFALTMYAIFTAPSPAALELPRSPQAVRVHADAAANILFFIIFLLSNLRGVRISTNVMYGSILRGCLMAQGVCQDCEQDHDAYDQLLQVGGYVEQV